MFYYVPRNYLGKTVTLVPKVPETAHVDEEGNIPRICVCPSALNAQLCQKFTISSSHPKTST